MENRNELMLDENQHRLLMCCRIAKALDKGEIYLDATGTKMFWRLEKNDRTSNIFHSIDEMEQHLECLLESAVRLNGRRGLSPSIKRRADIVFKRHDYRSNGVPMMFQSSVSR